MKRKNKIDRSERLTISHDNVVRAARLLSAEYFVNLKGDKRKTAVLTLKNGLLPMLRNSRYAIDAICDMCSESQGKEYNPMRCIKVCPVMKAATEMEKLATELHRAVSLFLPKEDDTEKGTVKGAAKKSKMTGDENGDDTKPSPVPA